jgi:hypothetical protein
MNSNIILIAVLCIAISVLLYSKNQIPPEKETIHDYTPPPQNDFHIYNHYKISVTIVAVSEDKKSHEIISADVPPGGRSGISMEIAKLWLTKGSSIKVYTDKKLDNFIGTTSIRTPENKLIRELHVGLNSSQYDIAIAAEPTKSPLGTALPRVRIVNMTPKTLRLNENIIIPPFRSYLYFGQYENGIPLGTKLRDMDGQLQDFVIQHPITDIYMGIVSDIAVPLYTGAKIGGEFDDEVNTIDFPLELTDMQKHRGMYIDRSYIPKNW